MTQSGEATSQEVASPVKVPKKRGRPSNASLKLASSPRQQQEARTDASPSSSNQKQRRKKDPHAPKAPLNAYLVYFNEIRDEIRATDPQMIFTDMTKIISVKWKEVSSEDKQRYAREAELDK